MIAGRVKRIDADRFQMSYECRQVVEICFATIYARQPVTDPRQENRHRIIAAA